MPTTMVLLLLPSSTSSSLSSPDPSLSLALLLVPSPSQPPSARLVALVLEHERMHHETLAYMQLQADVAALRAQQQRQQRHGGAGVGERQQKQQQQQSNGLHALPSPPSPGRPSLPPPLLDVLVPSGAVCMGTDASGARDGFVWDNEGPPVAAAVPRRFAVASRPVTVAQFHAFVTELRGYHRPELWQEEEDFTFLRRHGIEAPASWVLCRAGPGKGGEGREAGRSVSDGGRGGRMEYGVCGWGREARPWHEGADEAVMVSLAEAQAFCRAMGMEGAEGEGKGPCRVMTEEEWHRIVQWQPTVVTPAAAAAAAKERERQAQAVSPQAAELSALQRLQLSVRAGGWEWTSSEFRGFEGFRAMAEYPEYSTDFFDGRHFVLKGSSAATHPSLKRDSFRNYYQRQYPYVFAKFRCCRDADVDEVNADEVEAEER